MKCITVYTDSLEQLSVLYDKIVALKLAENEETTVEGVTVNDSGCVPERYIERMRAKPDVAVLRMKDSPVTILHRRGAFEILLPDSPNVIH